jgi:hypothetical protein
MPWNDNVKMSFLRVNLGWRGFRFDGGYRSLLGEEFAAAFVN